MAIKNISGYELETVTSAEFLYTNSTGAILKGTWSSLSASDLSGLDLQGVTDNGSSTTNSITVNGLTATADPIDAQGDLRARSNLRFDAYAPSSGHNLLIVGSGGSVFTRSENYYTTESWVTSQGYLTTETDPIFTAHVSSGITGTQISNWDTAHGWGDWSTGVDKAFVDALNVDADTLDGQHGSYYLAWANLTGVPSTFTPSAHTHVWADITDSPTAVSFFSNDAGYLTSADLNGYATESWVISQGYATQGWVTSQGYATQSWVNSQGFATQSWVNSQGYVTDNLTSMSFDASTGVLSGTVGATSVTTSLDGRYLSSVSLNDLTDVDASSNKNDGALLQWSSVLGKFLLTNELDLVIEGNDLVADNSPTSGQVYQFNGTTYQWATVTSGGVTSLNDIGDVSVASPNTNDVLTWNGSTWIASAAGGGAADGVVTGATFSGGTLTLTRSLSLSDVTVNLDGRYLQSYTETDPTGISSMAFSGSSTKTLTITRNNGSTVQASFTDLQGSGGGSVDGVVNSATFNTSNGQLSLGRTQGLADVVVSLEGRYGTMSGFFIKGDQNFTLGDDYVEHNDTLRIVGAAGGGVKTNYGTANDHEISIAIEGNGVTTSKISNLAVTEAKIASSAVTDSKIANGTISESKLNISNSPSAGDSLTYTTSGMTWAKSEIKTYNNWGSSIQSISVNPSSWVKIDNYTTENTFNSGSMVSESAGVFTVSESGVYEVTYRVRLGLTSNGESYRCGLSVNSGVPSESTTSDSLSGVGNLSMVTQMNLSANDTIELEIISTKTETINTNKVFVSIKKLS